MYTRAAVRLRALTTLLGTAALVAALTGGAATATPQSTNGTWPGFRGPALDGTTASRAFDDAGDFALDIAWKRPIGTGYAGLAVGDDVVVTMFVAGNQDVIAAFDVDNGAERWRVPLGPAYRGHDGSFDGPTSTPLIHDDRVIALAPRGRLLAIDVDGGEVAWEVDLPRDLGAQPPLYSFATSPLIVDGVLVVQIGAPGAALAGFDPASGHVLWTAGDDTIEYQSPIAMTVRGQRQIIAAGLQRLMGIDPVTGTVLWTFDHGGSGYEGAKSLVPVPAGEDRVFLAFKVESSTVLTLHPDAAEAAEQVWESRAIRKTFSVPVFHRGVIYGFSNRFLTAIDAGNGEALWKSRPPGDGFPMVVGDHLVILTMEGGVHVAAASADGYHETASVQVFDDVVWTPPAFAHGSVFARSMGELARVDVRRERVSAAAVRYADGTPPADSAFAAFLAQLESAADKDAPIDAWLARQPSFPVIEGDELVHFVYRGPGSDLALAGDVIGSRSEARMHRVEGTDLFYYTVRIAPEARVNYRFLRDYEPIVDPRNPRTTGSAFYGPLMDFSYDGTVYPMSWLGMPGWRAPSHIAPPSPSTARGRVVETTFDSTEAGGEQAISVYLPPGYDESEQRYPVAYFHGGGPALAVGEVPAGFDNLIAAGQQPLIAVFMPPLGYTGQSEPIVAVYDGYGRMWRDEIIPLVDRRFRTVATPAGRASIGGGSLGFTAAYLAFRFPEITDKVAILSPAFNDWRREMMEQWVQDAEAQPLDIYHEWGLYDARAAHENWDNRAKSRRLADYLREHEYTPIGGEVADGSGWSSWKNRLDRVISTLFPTTGR